MQLCQLQWYAAAAIALLLSCCCYIFKGSSEYNLGDGFGDDRKEMSNALAAIDGSTTLATAAATIIPYDLEDDDQYAAAAGAAGAAAPSQAIISLVFITIIYALILVAGIVGNVSTCIVIWSNRSMHTTTNYYLFSLAISDMLLLISGLPVEMHGMWWPGHFVFGDPVCMLQSYAAETSANATVLTITAFSVERYFAICHPFQMHTLRYKLSRAVRCVIAIWLIALGTAVPRAMQYGVVVEHRPETNATLYTCSLVRNIFAYAFQLSTVVFFVAPITLIALLYTLLAIRVRRSCSTYERQLSDNGLIHIMVRKQTSGTLAAAMTTVGGTATARNPSKRSSRENSTIGTGGSIRHSHAQSRVTKMLVAVVIAFVICWAPFHAQRLLAVYLSRSPLDMDNFGLITQIYFALYKVSGVLYFLSTAINPILYNIMSQKFRQCFKHTFSGRFRKRKDRHPSFIIEKSNTSLVHHNKIVTKGV